MTVGADTPIGLYSIGIRDLAMPDLLAWAAAAGIPFVHVRGGARGHAVLERPRHELERWRAASRSTCPITLVTSDATLGELTGADDHMRSAALYALERTCEAAAVLGATQVRILADSPPQSIKHAVRLPGDITLLIELHHPSWWTTGGLDAAADLACAEPRIRLLADTAQAAAGLAPYEPREARSLVAQTIALTRVLHLSDDGRGLDARGHALLAEAVRSADADIELGFEWTGEPRTAEACRQRYRAACTWWRSLGTTNRTGAES